MSSIKKNYLYNVIYEILLILLPLITSPFISRTLGVEAIGIYSYKYTIVSYFVLFSKLGIVNYGSRSIASAKNKNERSEIFFNAIALQFILTSIMIVCYFGFICLKVELNDLLNWVMFIYLLSAAIDINWFFFGIEKFKITITRNIVIKIISTIFIFSIIKNKGDLALYAIILAFGNLVGQVAIWPYLKGEIVFKYPTLLKMKRQLKEICILFVPQIAVSLYKMMDKIMIGNYCMESQLGLYECVSMIIGIPLGFITSLGTIMLPRISFLISQGVNKKSLEYTHYSLIFVSALSMALIFGLIGIADIFIPFYFGAEFKGAIILMKGLSVTIFFIAWANVIRTQFLIPKKKDKEYIFSLFIGAIGNIIINLILIPKYGALGAVVGTIFAEVIVCLIQTYMSRNYLPLLQYAYECLGYLPLGIIMYVIVYCIGNIKILPVFVLFLQIIIGVIVYLTLSFFYTKFYLKIDLIDMYKFKKGEKKK